MAAVDHVSDILAAGNADHPDRPALHIGRSVWTYGELWAGAVAVARGLVRRGVGDGSLVVIALPNDVDFVLAFFGALVAGGVAVPLFPRSTAARLASFAAQIGAEIVVQGDDRPPGHATVTVAELQSSSALAPRGGASDTCYLQYTSGSTADPRGVVITHDALLTNIAQMINAMSITRDDVFVSWLPTYHDMGLTLMMLTPLRLGTRAVLLPTELRNVGTWLEAIAEHRGTFTAGPDFAYRLCCRRIAPGDHSSLATLEVAMNASEPVRASTVREFEARFGLDHVMMTGYGLAEATLSVTCTPRRSLIDVDAHGLACLGAPVPGTDVTIVRGEREAGTGVIGEIVVRGPSLTHGYHLNDEATRALQWRDGYVRTGDTGYIDASGRLYFAAREKDVIKVAGRTLYPQEVEEIVDAIDSVRLAAAVGLDAGDLAGEQLHVVAELRDASRVGEDAIAMRITRDLHDALGLRPRRVHLVPPGSIPMTENGKLRRTAVRDTYRAAEPAR